MFVAAWPDLLVAIIMSLKTALEQTKLPLPTIEASRTGVLDPYIYIYIFYIYKTVATIWL